MRKILFSVLILLMSTISVNADEANKDVKEFVQLLSKDIRPSLSDYYRFYGEGSEEELGLELNECEKKGWTPPLSNPNCLDYVKFREAKRQETPSLYLEWLKTKLPASPRLKIIKTDHVSGKDVLKHDLIHATLNGINVVFFRTIGTPSKEQFGVLSISKINGVSVQKLLEKDLKKQKVGNKNIKK